jgi:hypothetical protein
MLTPEYLLRISEGAEEIAEELHQDILNRIIERIVVRLDRGDNYILTAYDKWQLQVLQDAGFLLDDIQKEIARKTPLMQNEIAEAMEEAGGTATGHRKHRGLLRDTDQEPLPGCTEGFATGRGQPSTRGTGYRPRQ